MVRTVSVPDRGGALAIINMVTREVNFKIVYYGTGLGGKTTNLKYIHSQLVASTRSDLISLATATERTLFFDFMSLDLGCVQGFRTRFSLYTVPGQVEYDASRKLILNGADGIIFVADSDPLKQRENVESLNNMATNLRHHDMSIDSTPWLLQYNKRDLSNAMDIDRMEKQLNPRRVPSFEAIAADGVGVFATLKQAAKLVLNRVQ